MRELRVKTFRVVVVEETLLPSNAMPVYPVVHIGPIIHRRVVAEGPVVPEASIPVVCRLLRQLAPVLRVGAHFRRALTVVTTNLKGNS